MTNNDQSARWLLANAEHVFELLKMASTLRHDQDAYFAAVKIHGRGDESQARLIAAKATERKFDAKRAQIHASWDGWADQENAEATQAARKEAEEREQLANSLAVLAGAIKGTLQHLGPAADVPQPVKSLRHTRVLNQGSTPQVIVHTLETGEETQHLDIREDREKCPWCLHV